MFTPMETPQREQPLAVPAPAGWVLAAVGAGLTGFAARRKGGAR